MAPDRGPTVFIGGDMPPELVADVSSALAAMGVVVKTSWAPPLPRTCKVITVVSPKGGSGKTAIASNLAVALAQRFPGRVVAVDLDAQFGDLASAFALTPEYTMAHLARSPDVDATTVKLFLTPFEHGLFVLAAANDPAEADSITHHHVTRVLSLLSQTFDFVIVDTPAGLDERTLAAVESSTDLLLVSSLDVNSIRSLRKAADALDHLGVTAPRLLVLNRADAKVGLTPADAQAALGMEIACSVPSSREVPLSLNLGRPLVASDPKSAVSRQLQLLTQVYAAPDADDKPKWGRRR